MNIVNNGVRTLLLPVICVTFLIGVAKEDKLDSNNKLEVIFLKDGERVFYKTPSGLEVSIICEKGEDTVSLVHPNRKPITYSSTEKKVTSSQLIKKENGREVSHLDRDGNGIPECQISVGGPREVTLERIVLTFEKWNK